MQRIVLKLKACLRIPPRIITPAPFGPIESPADCDLQNRVIRALRATGYPALRDIDVTVSESAVLLAGRTPTYYLKQTAQSAAMAVAGQHVVQNEILVTEPRAGVAAI